MAQVTKKTFLRFDEDEIDTLLNIIEQPSSVFWFHLQFFLIHTAHSLWIGENYLEIFYLTLYWYNPPDTKKFEAL